MTVRAYDPALGRFISHDPLGRLAALGLDTQPYVYAGNNPVNWTDPSGMLIMGSNGERAIITASGKPLIISKGRSCWEDLSCGNSSGSGSGSGSGGGGKSPKTTIKPKAYQPTPEDYGNAENAALMAGLKFAGWAALVAALIGGVAYASGLVAATSIPEWLTGFLDGLAIAQDAFAAQLTQLAWLLGTLQLESDFLSAAFLTVSGENTEWWTRGHLEDFFGVINTVISTAEAVAEAIGGVIATISNLPFIGILGGLAGWPIIAASTLTLAFNAQIYQATSDRAHNDIYSYLHL